MDKFKIIGPSKISGEVSISGSKNAALPILASTLLFDKPVILENLPRVRDIYTMLNLLKSLGSNIPVCPIAILLTSSYLRMRLHQSMQQLTLRLQQSMSVQYHQ